MGACAWGMCISIHFFFYMQFQAKIIPNNGLATPLPHELSTLWEILDPPMWMDL